MKGADPNGGGGATFSKVPRASEAEPHIIGAIVSLASATPARALTKGLMCPRRDYELSLIAVV